MQEPSSSLPAQVPDAIQGTGSATPLGEQSTKDSFLSTIMADK